MSWFKKSNEIWKKEPSKGSIAFYVSDSLNSMDDLRKALPQLTKMHPNIPFLFSAVFGRTFVVFYSSPSKISVDTHESRTFKDMHGYHGYYINGLDNPIEQKSKSWLSKQLETDNLTGSD